MKDKYAYSFVLIWWLIKLFPLLIYISCSSCRFVNQTTNYFKTYKIRITLNLSIISATFVVRSIFQKIIPPPYYVDEKRKLLLTNPLYYNKYHKKFPKSSTICNNDFIISFILRLICMVIMQLEEIWSAPHKARSVA